MIVLLVLAVYLIGALVTWRIAYGRMYGALYKRLSECTECVTRAARNDDKPFKSDLGCSIHDSMVERTFKDVLWITICWPFVAIGLLSFMLVMSIVGIIVKAAFPRGNRNRGYLTWNRAISSAQYNNKVRDLRRELRTLNIDPDKWLPADPELEPVDAVSTRQLESEGAVLGRRLQEISEALRQAKEVSASMRNVDPEQKRNVLEAKLRTPSRHLYESSWTYGPEA